jgi:hypothetical protein
MAILPFLLSLSQVLAFCFLLHLLRSSFPSQLSVVVVTNIGGGQGSVNDGAVGGSWRSKTRMMMLEEIRRCFAPFLF